MFKEFLKTKGYDAEKFKELKSSEQAEIYNEFIDSLANENGENKSAINDIESKLEKSATKEDLEAIKNDIEKLTKKTVRQVAFENARPTLKLMIAQNLKSEFERLGIVKDGKSTSDWQQKAKGLNVVVKADNAFNISVQAGSTSFPSDEANVDSTLLIETAIDLGFQSPLYREATILNEITNPTPLRVGDALKITVAHDLDGINPIPVKELCRKPKGAYKFKKETAESFKIAQGVVISEEFLNRFDVLVNEILNAVRILIVEKLEETAFNNTEGILQYAVPYSHVAGLEFETPTKLDAISAVATTMKNEKYKPTHVVLNHIDITTMFGAKGQDGHYQLYNGASILLINGQMTLFANGHTLKIVAVDSDLQAPGTFTVLDWNKLKFGLSPNLIIRYNPYSYFEDNAVEWLVELVYANILASTYDYAVVQDNFDDVINDITKV